MQTATTMVRARGLSKSYGDEATARVEAIRGVDLDIVQGELVAVLGPSGSGKTTLLHCLAGLEEFDTGEVSVDGRDLGSMSDDERSDWRSRRMGFVFQSFNLLPVLSAVENVEVPLLLLGERPRRARERARQALADVGLKDRATHRPEQLSGGEQQRVAVARAIVSEPAIVWADEPTGNLDSESASQVMDQLLRLHLSGHTVVFITHEQRLADMAGRRLRIRDGVLQADEANTPASPGVPVL